MKNTTVKLQVIEIPFSTVEFNEMTVGQVKKVEDITLDTTKLVMVKKPNGMIKPVQWTSFDSYNEALVLKNREYKVLHIFS